MTALDTNDYEELMRIVDIFRRVDIEAESPEGDPAAIQADVEWLIDLAVNRKVNDAEPYVLTIAGDTTDVMLEFCFTTRLGRKSEMERPADMAHTITELRRAIGSAIMHLRMELPEKALQKLLAVHHLDES